MVVDSGWEFNFGGNHPLETRYVVNTWPGNITFSGGELGGMIFSGQDLTIFAPEDSPTLAAYQWYVGRCSTTRESWDPLTTLYGIVGLDGFAELGMRDPLVYANSFGYNHVIANGSNAWVNDTAVTNQHWLRLADGVTNSSMSWALNKLYARSPAQVSCVL